jgi:hypothetical protein
MLYFKTLILILFINVFTVSSQEGMEGGIQIDTDSIFIDEYNTLIKFISDSTIWSESFPLLLRDPCYDYSMSVFWDGLHSPISVRLLIVNKIDDVSTLSVLYDFLLTYPLGICEYCNPDFLPRVPNCEISLISLIAERKAFLLAP